MTYFVPIINGYPLQLSSTKLDIAGQDLTAYLLKLLSDSGSLLVNTADREYIRDLKEKHCYVALDYDLEVSKNIVPSQQKKFQLPDGKEVNLDQEALTCSEALFNTSLIGRNNPGIHMQAQQSITSCDRSHWKTLFGHIILSGGTGAFSGLRLRLQREISKLVSPDVCVKESGPCSSPGQHNKAIAVGGGVGELALKLMSLRELSSLLICHVVAWVGRDALHHPNPLSINS